jgi:hypothetical protein
MDFFNFFFGKNNITRKINFEDVQILIKRDDVVLLNTININKQKCLIKKTLGASKEEPFIKNLIDANKFSTYIVVYGENCNENKMFEKYNQLINLGFINVFVYTGGLFEWLCLQDIYGNEEFPTTINELDIIKYRSKSIFQNLMLTNE